MMAQLTLAFPSRAALRRADFLVSKSNSAAIAWIDRWPDWPSPALALHGPQGCGKTHLVEIWRERAAASVLSGETVSYAAVEAIAAAPQQRVAVDDADCACERALLHLYNLCLERGGNILVTARRPPAAWSVALGDLSSRLRAALAVEIRHPDDALLGAVLVKHFADRQLRVSPGVVAYLTERMERSFAAAADIAARLDAASLRDRRPITLSLARRILDAAADQSLPSRKVCGVK